jgi:hypothetical protein
MVDGSASGSTTHEQVQAVTTLRSGSDEYQILYIWTPWFTLVRPLALLFYDDLVSFCVFMFCRSISEEWQIHVELLGKFGSSEELDRSNFARSRSIELFQNLLLQKRARTPNQERLQ